MKINKKACIKEKYGFSINRYIVTKNRNNEKFKKRYSKRKKK